MEPGRQVMSHSVRNHLRLEIDSYDETIRQFIPGYEEGLTWAAREIAGIRPTLVLDLGAGTGLWQRRCWNMKAWASSRPSTWMRRC